MPFSKTRELRFWEKVGPLNENGCRLWLGPVGYRNGYGKFGKDLAHRLAYTFDVGPIPPGQCVRHACDNRLCCEASHLSLGSRADNIRDRVERGRCARGTRQHLAKLNDDAVRQIRKMLAEGRTMTSIAKEFGVSICPIAYIRDGRSWRHVV